MISCIIIDDEPLALKMLATYVKQTPFLELSGAFSNAIEALNYIGSNEVELVITDIQMPDLNGLQLATLINQSTHENPKLIFTTAYDQFAIDGYKVNAVDYLLKPIQYDDFLRAVLKVKEQSEKQHSIITKEDPEFLYLKLDYKYLRIPYKDIILIESVKDYVKIHIVNNLTPIMILSSLKSIESKLPVDRFLRVHRSFIIGKEHITYLTKSSVNIANTEIIVGDIYKDAFKKLLEAWSNEQE